MGRAVRLTKTNIIAALAAVLIAVPGGYMLLNRSSSEPVVKEKAGQIQEVASVQTKTAPGYVKYQGEAGETALDLLKKHADVETEDSEFGEFVTAVNGEDGGGEKYWLFYVGGKEASVGAGDYVTKDGETIEWKLQ